MVAPFVVSSVLLAQREEIVLSQGWSFIRQDMGPAAEPDSLWTTVSVPHTWNNVDGQDGKAAEPKLSDGYYRGAGWYYLPLNLPPDLGERRAIVRCEAVNQVADIYLNDHHVGQHRGGYTAFAFDVTPFLDHRGKNVLRIRADNSRFPDVAPLNADFTFFGGAYRPVTLFLVEPAHFSFGDHGSQGIYLTTRNVSGDSADVDVRTLVSNELGRAANVTIEITVADAGGHKVATEKRVVSVGPGATLAVDQVVAIPQPHRWNGRLDPYLYRVTARLTREGRAADAVSADLGVHTIAIDEARGFLLNGEPYPIRGVSRHQDRLDRGTALSAVEEAEDMQLIADMGATAVRLAHYPQSENIHRLADQLGLLLWEEIPNVERMPSLPEFMPTMTAQLEEMIRQGYNHPSVAFWGLFNEAKAVWQSPMGAPPEPLLNELRARAEALDHSRLIVGASWLRDHDPLHDTVPYPGFNQYPGWKFGTPEDMAPIVALISKNHGGRRIAISEYGAGASIHHHLETGLAPPPNTETNFHPEEWQAIVHEGNWRVLKDNPRIWGSFAWNMFDFAADNRNEGDTPGRNDKGLVTYDRKTRKDAYFFYQANWTTKPMVYLAGRRLDRRRINPVAEVKIYSNCAEVELFVNGSSRGKLRPDDIAVCRWPAVALQPGANRIAAVARTSDGREFRDECSWFLEVER
ncbi:MAG: hypothetical protein JWM35_579 [Verrucomicrobia bacterium]|nr:hypothetical protein [Verrucomicrobiota bacterium]